jgi:ketosteroid isomerase-like protein
MWPVARSQARSEAALLSRLKTMSQREQNLLSAYRAFNAHDLDAALKLMHPDVDWPNAWQGGRVVGRAAVADYWHRQFSEIISTVEPQAFS